MHPFLIKIHCLPSLQYKNAGCLGINEVPPGKKHAHHPPDQRSGVEGSWGLDTTGLGTQENREKHRTQNTELGTQNTELGTQEHREPRILVRKRRLIRDVPPAPSCKLQS